MGDPLVIAAPCGVSPKGNFRAEINQWKKQKRTVHHWHKMCVSHIRKLPDEMSAIRSPHLITERMRFWGAAAGAGAGAGAIGASINMLYGR